MNKCIFSLSLNRVCGFKKKINMKKVSPVLTISQIKNKFKKPSFLKRCKCKI